MVDMLIRKRGLLRSVKDRVFGQWFALLVSFRWMFSKNHWRPAQLEDVVLSLASSQVESPALLRTLKSLFLQTARPGHVLLWIVYDDIMKLPQQIWALEMFGLEVRVAEDLAAPRKLAAAVEKYQELVVLEVAAEKYYPAGWLASVVGAKPESAGKARLRHSHGIPAGGNF
jgi:hypothetical protein